MFIYRIEHDNIFDIRLVITNLHKQPYMVFRNNIKYYS